MTEVADRAVTPTDGLGMSQVSFTGDLTVAGQIAATVIGCGEGWAGELVASLSPAERAMVVVPFEPGADVVAHRLAGGPSALLPPSGVPHTRRHQVTELPPVATYAARVGAALDLIEAGRVQKVVLGRSLEVVSDPPLDPADLVSRLLRRRPGRYVFGVPLAAGAGSPILIGASPELLVRREGRVVSSFPLAGSMPRSADPVVDAARARELLESEKDLAEHAYVVGSIVTALRSVCGDVSFDAHPRLVSTDTLHHLGSRIEATIAPGASGPSALELAQLLHPTPAVGGVPRETALEIIRELEEERGPVTGAVGWVDGTGDGQFAVTIRSGVLDGPRLRLHAGAGIVRGSIPEAEVRETRAKLDTMLRAVGLSVVTPSHPEVGR